MTSVGRTYLLCYSTGGIFAKQGMSFMNCSCTRPTISVLCYSVIFLTNGEFFSRLWRHDEHQCGQQRHQYTRHGQSKGQERYPTTHAQDKAADDVLICKGQCTRVNPSLDYFPFTVWQKVVGVKIVIRSRYLYPFAAIHPRGYLIETLLGIKRVKGNLKEENVVINYKS